MQQCEHAMKNRLSRNDGLKHVIDIYNTRINSSCADHFHELRDSFECAVLKRYSEGLGKYLTTAYIFFTFFFVSRFPLQVRTF